MKSIENTMPINYNKLMQSPILSKETLSPNSSGRASAATTRSLPFTIKIQKRKRNTTPLTVNTAQLRPCISATSYISLPA